MLLGAANRWSSTHPKQKMLGQPAWHAERKSSQHDKVAATLDVPLSQLMAEIERGL